MATVGVKGLSGTTVRLASVQQELGDTFLAIAKRPRSAIVRPRSTRPAPGVTSISPEQDLAEGEPEVGVEDGVDDGVQQTVEVAEPDNDAD